MQILRFHNRPRQGLVISDTFHTVVEGAVTLTLIGNFVAKQASAKCFSLTIHTPEAPKQVAFVDVS